MAASDGPRRLASVGLPAVAPEDLGQWMTRQRWFGRKARAESQMAILDALVLSERPGDPLFLLMMEVRTPAGTHEIYQLPVGLARGGPYVSSATGQSEENGSSPPGPILQWQQGALYDALTDEAQMAALGRLIAEEATITHGTTTVAFHSAQSLELVEHPSTRHVDTEQSNSSVVIDDRYILKAFRRIEPGINPELEMLRFLSGHGFARIAPVLGWYGYQSDLLQATLGVMQPYIAGATDGWKLVVDGLSRGESEPLIGHLGLLGTVTGEMHTVLASDAEDSEFLPEEPSDEHIALLAATIDEQIERLFVELPRREVLEPIIGRGEELRDRLALLSHAGTGGRLIRTHGDYHLGQAMMADDGWIVIDFEGEPARRLPDRRRKRSALRDVAGMLRSFAYASLSVARLHGSRPVPADWERRARQSFLNSYMTAVDTALLPAGSRAIEKQLAMFELEKVLYELRYELENRPDWLEIPVRAIVRLLEEDGDE